MEDHVEGERKAQLLNPTGDFDLSLECAMPRDAVRLGRLDVLDGHLDVVEPEPTQALQPLAPERDAARDQVGVQIELARGRDQQLEVVAHQRLAAREVELHDAEILGLAKHPLPGRSVQLGAVTSVIERI